MVRKERNEMGFSFALMFLCVSTLTSLGLKNLTMEIINTTGINQRFYPQKYVAPRRWQKRLFKFERRMIPQYLYNELYMAVFYGVLGPINIFISILTDFKGAVVGSLMMFHCCLVILNLIYFGVMTFRFKRK